MSKEEIAGLLEICNLMQEGLCLEKKWGKCPYPESDNNDGNKCGLCCAEYITEELGYRKLEGEPPLLSDKEITKTIVAATMRTTAPKSAWKAMCQAQRDSDVRWYKNNG